MTLNAPALVVRRFRQDDVVSNRVPVNVKGGGESPTGDDAASDSLPVVNPEDEQFEWGEVIRGASSLQYIRDASATNKGFMLPALDFR